jgi:hypothetical protein
MEELRHAAEALRVADGRYVFDEGEEGQPAFVFEPVGLRAFFTIAASEISDGQPHPEWQRVEFSPADFLTTHDCFRKSFIEELRVTAPLVADGWLKRFVLK